MSGERHPGGELTPSYRTLDEPTRLIGLSVGQLGALALTIGLAYLFLLVSPLPWRANFTLVIAFGGGPLILMLLREQGALSAGRLVAAISRWRFRPALLMPSPPGMAAPNGAVHLDEASDADTVTEVDQELAAILGESAESSL